MTEDINFKLYFSAEYAKEPPHIEVYVNDAKKFAGTVGNEIISFNHNLILGTNQSLRIVRSGNLIDPTQMLVLEQVDIDGINIRNIVWSRSYYSPIYPEPWATQQREQGIELEENVIGETWFGHDGTWTLDFSSPFYMYMFNWMK